MRFRVPWAVALAALALACGHARAVTFGDLTGDGKVNVADATVALQIAVGLVQATPDQTFAGDVAPVNTATGVFGDGKINVADATRLLRKAVGLESDQGWPGTQSFNQAPPSTLGVPLGTVYQLTVSGDTKQDFALPGGFKVQGHLTGPGQMTGESLLFIDPTTFIGTSSEIDESGGYLAGLPAGTYQVYYSTTVETQVPGGTTAGTTTIGTTTVGTATVGTTTVGTTTVGTTTAGTTSAGTTSTGTTSAGTTSAGTTTIGFPTNGPLALTCIPAGLPDGIYPQCSTVSPTDPVTPCVPSPAPHTCGPGESPFGNITIGGLTAGGVTAGGLTAGGLTAGDLTAGTTTSGLQADSGATPLQFGGSVSTDLNILIGTLTVKGDTSQDFTRPTLPHLFKVTGQVTLTGQAVMPPYRVSFDQGATGTNGMPAEPSASSSVESTDGSYTVYLPAGTYTPRIEVQDFTMGISADLTAQPQQVQISADTTQNLAATVPALVTLSGTVTLAGGGALPAGSSNSVSASLVIDQTNASHVSTNSSGVNNGQYSIKLEPGNYNVSLSYGQAQDFLTSWQYKVGTVSVPADTVKAIIAPPLPLGRASISGRVLGPTGTAITKGFMSMTSKSLSGADPSLTFSTTLQVGADGSYSASVPPGAYSIVVFPQLDFPTAFVYPPGTFPVNGMGPTLGP